MHIKSLTLTTLAVSGAAGMAGASTDAWEMLKQITIDEHVTETTYEVSKTFPAAMQPEGTEVEITGYATPRLPGETMGELLLVSDMGLCPLCGSLDHGAGLQVMLSSDIPTIEEGTRITLRGTLNRVTDPETWQAAILENARIVPD